MADQRLPDNALVVRGGLNLPEQFETGSGVVIDDQGKLQRVSVNCAAEKTVQELAQTIPNNRIGVTNVGDVRAAGGDVVMAHRTWNPYHCMLGGIDAQTASALFMPTVVNPNKPQGR